MTRQLPVLFVLVALATASPATQTPDPQTYTGVIIDFECAGIGHQHMQMGPTDADCVRLCVLLHGVPYVLEDGDNVYFLSDQQAPVKFAAQRVVVTGVLDTANMTIAVQGIAAAPD
jgi:hypothetical protein